MKFYSPTLKWMLRQNLLTILVLGACVYGTFFYVSKLPKIFFPEGDSGFAQGVFLAATKDSPYTIGEAQEFVLKTLMDNDATQEIISVSGVSGFMSSNMGIVFTVLKDKSQRASIQEVVNSINAKGSCIPGVILALHPEPVLKISTGAVSTQLGKYQFALSSMEVDMLYESARRLMAKMREKQGIYFSNIASDMYLDNPQADLAIDRNKASMLGITASGFSSVARDSYAQMFYYLIKTTFNQYWTILETKPEDRAFLSDLESLYFSQDATMTGGEPVVPIGADPQAYLLSKANRAYNLSDMVPFNSFAKATPVLAPVSVNHIDNFPSVTISFDLMDGVAIGDVINWMTPVAEEILPQEIAGKFIGEAVTFSETMRSMIILLFVAIFVMYVILGVLYESYIHPITVLIALPVAICGGFASLYYMDYQLSLYGWIGIFMLMGIVKKNGIMIVDFAIVRQNEGKSRTEAIHEACLDRFRPIMMTTFAALMGMVPIALGWGKADAESRIPLGVVVVGGLIFSQIITLYITPVVYVWMDWIQTKILDKIPFFARGKLND